MTQRTKWAILLFVFIFLQMSGIVIQHNFFKNTYEKKIQASYNTGYKNGSNHNYAQSELEELESIAYEMGYIDGYSSMKNASYETGYKEGYEKGQIDLYSDMSDYDNYSVGYEDGYNIGYDEGWSDGEDYGYENGKENIFPKIIDLFLNFFLPALFATMFAFILSFTIIDIIIEKIKANQKSCITKPILNKSQFNFFVFELIFSIVYLILFFYFKVNILYTLGIFPLCALIYFYILFRSVPDRSWVTTKLCFPILIPIFSFFIIDILDYHIVLVLILICADISFFLAFTKYQQL